VPTTKLVRLSFFGADAHRIKDQCIHEAIDWYLERKGGSSQSRIKRADDFSDRGNWGGFKIRPDQQFTNFLPTLWPRRRVDSAPHATKSRQYLAPKGLFELEERMELKGSK